MTYRGMQVKVVALLGPEVSRRYRRVAVARVAACVTRPPGVAMVHEFALVGWLLKGVCWARAEGVIVHVLWWGW